MANQCSARTYRDAWHSKACTKTAKVEREGKWYCGTHDPEAIKAKRDKRDAEWKAEQDERQKVSEEHARRRTAIEKLCGHIPTDDLGKYVLALKAE